MTHIIFDITPEPSFIFHKSVHLLLILSIITTVLLGLGSTSLLSADTTWTSTSKWRVERKIDVLLGIETNDERRDVDNLLADTDVSLADEDTGVVDRLGETELVNAGLKTTLQEILNLQGQDVIELHARLVENTNANETANESITLEETLWVLLVESEKLTIHGQKAAISSNEIHQNIPSSTTNLGESEEHTPHLTLVAETVFTNSLQLRVPGDELVVSIDLNKSALLLSGQEMSYRRADSNGLLGTL